MKKEFEMIAFQALLVNFLIIFINGLIGCIAYLNGNIFTFSPLFLIGSCITSVLSAMATLIFHIKPFQRLPFFFQLFIHFLVLSCIVFFASFAFSWAREVREYLVLFSIFTVIYIVVWVVTAMKLKRSEKDINQALKKQANLEE